MMGRMPLNIAVLSVPARLATFLLTGLDGFDVFFRPFLTGVTTPEKPRDISR